MSWSRTLQQALGGRTTRAGAARVRPGVEALESRVVPYAVSGDFWSHPELITLSFVPDGTVVGSNGSSYLRSNLFATLNAKFGSASVWENQILKAAQSWAQQTNINFAVVPDDGSSIGSGSYQQGDPAKGDIRISGYNFGFSNGNLAQAEMPPQVNNYSVAGDIQLNTGQALNIGSTYDLYTVAVHEIGHALGLDHSSSSLADMYSSYVSARTGLTSDDVAGIRAIYSGSKPRSPDASYGGATPNSSFAAAASLTSLLNPQSLTAVVSNLDITTTSEAEYYSVVAPSGTSGTLTLQVQSSGLSLLAPKVTVYAADQATVLGSATATGLQGATLTVTVSGVTAGQLLYIKVSGNTSVATGPTTQTSNLFATGAYALTLNFGTGPSPAVPRPNTTTANGNPLSMGGGLANGTVLPLPGVFALLFNLVARDTLEVADTSPGSATAALTGPAAPAPAGPGHGHPHHQGHHGVQHPQLTPGDIPLRNVPTGKHGRPPSHLPRAWEALVDQLAIEGWRVGSAF
jgi:hypothetical protein